MKLIIGSMSIKLRDFLKKYQFSDRILVINKMCNVKTIKNSVDVIIPFGKVEPSGLITNTQVHLEELLMSINVKSIKYGNPSAKNMIEKISKKYEIPCSYIDLLNYDRSIKL